MKRINLFRLILYLLKLLKIFFLKYEVVNIVNTLTLYFLSIFRNYYIFNVNV